MALAPQDMFGCIYTMEDQSLCNSREMKMMNRALVCWVTFWAAET